MAARAGRMALIGLLAATGLLGAGQPAIGANRPAGVSLDSPLKTGHHQVSGHLLTGRRLQTPRSAANPNAAAATCDTTWQRVDAVNGPGDDVLGAVSGTSAKDIWGVGWTTAVLQQGPSRTLTEHWNGTSWSTVASPSATLSDNNLLVGVSSSGTGDVWAVGGYVRTRDSGGNAIYSTLAEHYDGSTWITVGLPGLGAGTNVFNGVSALASNDAWAVGTQAPAGQGRLTTLIEHWNGISWSVVASPNAGSGNNSLNDIVALAPNNIWAVGYYRPANGSGSYRDTLILHWNGSSWARIASPNKVSGLDNTLYAVSGSSANDVWVVGAYARPPDNDPSTADYVDQTLVLHWNGVSWAIIPSPNPGTPPAAFGNPGGNQDLFGVVSRASNDAWAVGSWAYVPEGQGVTPIYHTMALHWDGVRWNDNAYDTWGGTYAELDDVVSLGGVWAVGSLDWPTQNGNEVQPLVATVCSPPVANAVNPGSGPTKGGRAVLIEGAGLSMATGVNFGTIAAASYTILSDSRIIAITPAEPAGSVDITIRYFAGTGPLTAGDRYTFADPRPVGPWWSRILAR
jgi:IPT/TIG domain